jgi:hypothetical protein
MTGTAAFVYMKANSRRCHAISIAHAILRRLVLRIRGSVGVTGISRGGVCFGLFAAWASRASLTYRFVISDSELFVALW